MMKNNLFGAYLCQILTILFCNNVCTGHISGKQAVYKIYEDPKIYLKKIFIKIVCAVICKKVSIGFCVCLGQKKGKFTKLYQIISLAYIVTHARCEFGHNRFCGLEARDDHRHLDIL